MKRRSCCVFGGEQKEKFIGNSCQKILLLIHKYIANNSISVAQKLKGKYKKVYFLHDNARPHISRMARKKIQDLKWINLPHPPYPPDLAPTDYHLFLSLSNHLKFKNYDEKKEVEDDLKIFFENKSMEFYRNGILSLYQRWEKVEENNGEYYN